MDLFDRYVNEVGQSLPAKLRPDVQAELHSLLQDQLEERAAAAGRPADEEVALEVLRAMGRPDEVAARYQPARSLIGPQLYPIYIAILKGMLVFVGAVLLFFTWVASGLRPGTMPPMFTWEGWVDLMGEFTQLALLNFGLLTVVFAILERVQRPKAETGSTTDSTWDPRTLPKLEEPRRVSRWQIGWQIYVIVTLLILANLFPAGVALTARHDGQWIRIPLLLPALREHLIWLDLWWLNALVLNLMVLQRRRWDRVTLWAEVVLGVLAFFLLRHLAAGPAFVGVDPAWAADQGFTDARALVRLNGLAWGFMRIMLLIGMWACVIETVIRVYRLVRGRTPAWVRWHRGGAVAS